mmetsp:Transcript_1680/g.2797  ORF Transcript_1680/g.2797 Transcript_1680/m.2797 type:complete len:190 (-) Transcript_1680:1052-1621(-)|eukprot:CAMPEP_0197477172 /NCGR_PEP_ID=MMETSP1309-20131121/14440_1 /TAXON_ID=464262 /ORGANISM="Genus nov. species nov., Strain RCC998" /LENGTH=189 /DNA_ID=CAMNT_0043017977 /DNA_START=85 /DNA_END=654 /DNA_ORIENTATION=+
MTTEFEEEEQNMASPVEVEAEEDQAGQPDSLEASPVIEKEEEEVFEPEPELTEVGAPSPVLDSPEPSPVLDLPEPSPVMEPQSQATVAKIEEKSKEEAEKKRELLQNGQAELRSMMEEAEQKMAKKREAALAQNLEREREVADKRSTPSSDMSRGESWTVVCDLIDFKRDVSKADLSSFKSLMIQLKHA